MEKYYLTLLSLEIQHNYYNDSLSKDFVIQPTPDTARILRNNRIQIRALKSGFQLVYEATDAGPVLPIEDAVLFAFTMQLKDTPFLNFTDLDDKANKNTVYYYNNDGGGFALNNLTIDLWGNIVNYQLQSSQNTVKLRVTTLSGYAVFDEILSSTDEDPPGTFNYEQQLNFYGRSIGLYKVEHLSAPGYSVPEAGFIVYVDPSLRPSNIFGLLLLKEDATSLADAYQQPDPDPTKYLLRYYRKEMPWEYDLALENNDDLDTFFIEDTDPSPQSPYHLVGAPLQGTPVGGDPELLNFVTPAQPFFQETNRQLQLVKYDAAMSPGSREVMINPLPNPAIGRTNAKTLLYL